MIDPHTRAGHIRRNLLTIRDHYEQALHATASADESGIRGESRREPIPVRVLDARAEAHRDLASWVNFILMEVNGGTITRGPSGTDIHSLAEYVARWCQAICEQCPDDAENLEAEVKQHAGKLQALALGWQTKRIEVGQCPESYLTEDETTIVRCTGGLWAVMHSRDSMLPQAVTCDACSRSWVPSQWRDLGRKLGRDIAALSSVEEAVEQGVTDRTIRRRRQAARGV